MITLTLPYPPSANRFHAPRVIQGKGRKAFVTMYTPAEGVAYKATVGSLCRAKGVKKIPGRIHLEIWLYPARPQDWQKRADRIVTNHNDNGVTGWDDSVRCLDLDNANKAVLDSLKGIAFDDDKMVRSMQTERMTPDEHGARLVVRISQWEPYTENDEDGPSKKSTA